MAKRKSGNFGRLISIAASPVIYKDKFLLIKRIKPPYVGYWSMPGGKIDFAEEIKQTIVREIKEETGLSIKFIAIRGFVEEILSNGKVKDAHYHIWVCETKAKNNKASSQQEGEIGWFTKAEILKNKKHIIPSDFEMIKTFFFQKRTKIAIFKSYMQNIGKSYSMEYFGR